MEVAILNDILIIFGLSIGVLLVCHRLRIPATVGLLLTGILAGPHGLKLVRAVHEVELLAEIGVLLLLFTIGMEFSLKTLAKLKKTVLLGGSLQVVLTCVAVLLLMRRFVGTWGEATFLGFLAALSSTAIVLKLLQERGEVDSPHGNTSLAILIFQDIIIVPMVLFTPMLTGAVQNVAGSLALMLAKGAGIILLVIVSARYLVPKLFYQVSRTRIPELFLATLLVICLAIVWLTSSLGLSLALGAFLAGLIVSDSEYSHQALGNIIPFRDVFTSFFFVSIGMLLNVGFCIEEPLLITGAAMGVFLLKSVVAAFVSLLVGLPLRTAVLVGLSLGQLGEFSFILSKEGVAEGLLAGNAYQVFLAVAILTMAATPYIVRYSARIADGIVALPWPERMKTRCVSCAVDAGPEPLKEQLIIVGFGLTGRNIAEAAKASGIPYTITEMNVDTVRAQRAKGEPIFLGDATQDSVLRHARIHQARVVAVAINDPTATRRITAVVRRLNPKVFIIVRTRYIIEVEPLYRLGANMVIPEEYETSVEIFTRVLAEYEIPAEEIDRFADQIREAGYRMFRRPSRNWKEGA